MTLNELNQLPEDSLETQLLHCCGSRKWVQLMIRSRPFKNKNDLLAKAEKAGENLNADDWLEAFKHHPTIGGPKRSQQANQGSAWANAEQSGVNDSSSEILSELETKNRQYFEKFGFVFLICATGKSGSEILGALKSRIHHDRAEELKIASGEQKKITRLRLEKLLK